MNLNEKRDNKITNKYHRIKKRIKKILEIILFPVLNTNLFENARQENSSASFSRSIRGAAANKKRIEPWLFVRGWTVYLRGIYRQPRVLKLDRTEQK